MRLDITNGDPVPCHNCGTTQFLYSRHCFGAYVGCGKCHLTAPGVPFLFTNDARADDWMQGNAVHAWNLMVEQKLTEARDKE